PSTLHCLPSLHDTPTTAIYTLSLHDALPICRRIDAGAKRGKAEHALDFARNGPRAVAFGKSEFFHGGAAQSAAWREQRDCLDQRSEEHTSELQSPDHLVCRLLLEKKKENKTR